MQNEAVIAAKLAESKSEIRYDAYTPGGLAAEGGTVEMKNLATSDDYMHAV